MLIGVDLCMFMRTIKCDKLPQNMGFGGVSFFFFFDLLLLLD